MRISIVLPAYNESAGLARCLDSIARQTALPHEVIVVDNNSTDDTVGIATQYDFVTVISETKQGITPATKAGFRAASGDVIARFNADVILEEAWVEKTSAYFETHSEADGMTGLARIPVLPFLPLYSKLWTRMYSLGVEAYLGAVPVWGGNYALRADVAKTMIERLTRDVYFDDIDLGLWLAHKGHRVGRVDEPVVTTDDVSYGYFVKMLVYLRRTIRTKQLHIRKRHYPLPETTRLSAAQRTWRFAVCVVPLTLYVLISLFAVPVYVAREKLVQ